MFRIHRSLVIQPLRQHHHLVFFARTPDGGDFAVDRAQSEGRIQNARFGRLQPRFRNLVDGHRVGDQLVIAHGTISGPQTLLNERAPNALGSALFGRDAFCGQRFALAGFRR